MDIAQLLTGSSGSAGSLDASSSRQMSENDYSNFTDYMNTFIEASNSVKKSVDYQRKDSFEQIRIKDDKILHTGFKEEQDWQNDEFNTMSVETPFPVQPLSLKEKEAFERIAVMISDGGLDGESLEGLSEEEISELVDWVLAGAGGLFPVYDVEEFIAESGSNTEGTEDLFGLSRSAEALQQLEDLFGRISQDSGTGSEVSVIAKLVDLEGMDSLEIDKLSQAILNLAQEYAGDGTVEVVAGNNSAVNLREVLAQVPADELKATINEALQEISSNNGSSIDILPEMPDSVLKSLSIEIINVNNGILDAADMRSRLLDGLSNNSQLREEILGSIASKEVGEELLAAVKDNTDSDLLSDSVVNELADAVLEDSSTEELRELAEESVLAEKENSNNSGTVIEDLKEDEKNAENKISAEPVQLENLTTVAQTKENTVESVNVNNEKQLADSLQNQDITKNVENVKVTVNEESLKGNEQQGQQEINTKKEENSTGKDVLTGRSFTEQKEKQQVSSEQNSSQNNNENSQKKNETSTGFSSLFDKNDVAAEAEKNISFTENFSDSETKAEFKVFTPENSQSNYVNDNVNVRYADVLENMERIEKLLMSTSDKTLKSVTLEFSPPELGKLTIDVSVKNGSATASLKVESDSAKNMLLSNVEQLKKNLESHGIKLENFEVELNKQDQQDKNQQGAFAQAQQQEQERRARQGNRNRRLHGGDVESADSEIAEEINQDSKIINDDGSVDIVA